MTPVYAELAVTTNFSFLRGASHPEDYVAEAARLNLAGIGIADRNTISGVVRAHVALKETEWDEIKKEIVGDYFDKPDEEEKESGSENEI